jgi:cytochrome c556
MNRIIKTVAVVVIFGILIGAAYAQFAKPEDAIKYRKAVMTIIVQHFGRMGAMVKGKVPYDQETFAGNAAVGKTAMKSSVLKNQGDFRKLAQEFEAEVAKLSAVARGGDVDAAKAQFGAVAQSCKSCHSKSKK